jgi:hypothetical protein
MSAESTADVLDRAAAYVCEHGRYMREGVYSVRYPQYASNGFILADDTYKLTQEVARRMSAEEAR